jgi:hypothetical protein
LDPPKFLMFLRFIQHIVNCELKEKISKSGITLKIGKMNLGLFKTLKKSSTGVSGEITPLLDNMLEQNALGDNTADLADVEPTPDTTTTTTQQPQTPHIHSTRVFIGRHEHGPFNLIILFYFATYNLQSKYNVCKIFIFKL